MSNHGWNAIDWRALVSLAGAILFLAVVGWAALNIIASGLCAWDRISNHPTHRCD